MKVRDLEEQMKLQTLKIVELETKESSFAFVPQDKEMLAEEEEKKEEARQADAETEVETVLENQE